MILRIYAVSIMAFAPFVDADHPGQNTLTYHIPALIPAETIEEAAERAREHCFSLWSPAEGWYAHQAAILPVTKQFYDLALTTYKEGSIDLVSEPEQERVFQFDPQQL